MKNIVKGFTLLVLWLISGNAMAEGGKCGNKLKWDFDGMILTISYEGTDGKGSKIEDYDMKAHLSPWNKKGLNKKIRKIIIGEGITGIGSCAFYSCAEARSVEFQGQVEEIGWGAFSGCSRLLNVYMPQSVKQIGRIAFSNCTRLGAVEIPEDCNVDDYAFMSCTNISNLVIPQSAHIGEYAFVSEMKVDGNSRFALYGGDIADLPSYITGENCKRYGLSRESVLAYRRDHIDDPIIHEFDALTGNSSDVNSNIPETTEKRNNTFALIFGNEKYTKVPTVPYAMNDASTFSTYCEKALGVPKQNIISSLNAGLVDMQEYIEKLGKRVSVRKEAGEPVEVIVYYAGHGVPDEASKNAYLLPTDVSAENANRGISLQDFYSKLAEMQADKVTVFLDACFSGAKRDGGMISDARGVAIRAKETTLKGNMVVFSAAQGTETAHPYNEKSHGLFTYFLLKRLQETKGSTSYKSLADYIYQNVRETALGLDNQKDQTPTTTPSSAIGKDWERWRF